MEPFQQGGLDSLCGIYSLVNAEKVINQSKTEHSQDLFNDIVTSLEEEKLLASILTDGMLLKNLKFILNQVLADRIPQKTLPFHSKPNPNLGKFWSEVELFLSKKNRAVIISLSGVHEHWSTVEKITGKKIKLFDSDGLNYLNRSYCTTAEATIKRPHIICSAQTLFLSK
jgi:hypothetical protein